MDKNTLSNYGWIVIAVLVLSVMIALATPFGEYIKAGVESTTAGLFDTSEKAMNVVGMSAKSTNDLSEKKIALFGTSISTGEASKSKKSYMHIIVNDNDMHLDSFAKTSKGITYVLEQYNLNKTVLDSYTENDFVIVEGLLNSAGIRQGDVTPIGTTTFDTSTSIGALEEFIYQYKNSGCKAKIGFILTHYSGNAYNDSDLFAKYELLWSKAIQVFEKYDIPYVDLRDKGYATDDNLHPNDEGNIAMAKDVESWLKTV